MKIGCFVIGHLAWRLRIPMEQCNDLLERPPNNSFTMRNFQCPKQPLLDQLHIDMPGGGEGLRISIDRDD